MKNGLLRIAAQCWIVHETLKQEHTIQNHSTPVHLFMFVYILWRQCLGVLGEGKYDEQVGNKLQRSHTNEHKHLGVMSAENSLKEMSGGFRGGEILKKGS